jgi:hypothetical protein
LARGYGAGNADSADETQISSDRFNPRLLFSSVEICQGEKSDQTAEQGTRHRLSRELCEFDLLRQLGSWN